MAKQELIDKQDSGLSTLQPYDAQIDELESTCMALTVASVDDKEGLKAAHEWRMKVKKLRIEVDKEGKRLREDAVKRQKAVLAETNRIIGRIKPIEDHLQEQEDIVEREKERLRQEAIEANRLKNAERLKALQAVGVAALEFEIVGLTDEQFAAKLADARAAWDAKQKAEAEAREKAERERAELEKLRAEQERIRQEQERQASELRKQQEAIEAERRKIEAEKAAELRKQQEAEREKQRQTEIEKAKAEAAERAAREERERLEREQREAQERAEREERERLEEEAARPYKTKLRALADTVEGLEVPEGKHSMEVGVVLAEAAKQIRAIAKKR